jgi:hypothetical protein
MQNALKITIKDKHKIMLDKLSKLHKLPETKVVEILIQREAVNFGLLESR